MGYNCKAQGRGRQLFIYLPANAVREQKIVKGNRVHIDLISNPNPEVIEAPIHKRNNFKKEPAQVEEKKTRQVINVKETEPVEPISEPADANKIPEGKPPWLQ